MWKLLDELQQQLLQNENIILLKKKSLVPHETPPSETTEITREDILARIESILETVLKSISLEAEPCLSYGSRSLWENVRFQEGLGLEMKDRSVLTFDSEGDVTHVPTCSVKFLLDKKLATSKGCIAGDLQYIADGQFVDCNQTLTGFLLPSHIQELQNMQSNAKFVLVVEKDATFQRLMDDGICRKLFPCIIITGKGFPDLNTRLMVRRLWEEFHLPTLALVDADPHGIEIISVYKFGSRSLSFESHNLTVPSIRWLGLWPSDIHSFNIPPSSLIPLTKADKAKATELLQRPYISAQPGWKIQLECLLKSGVKAEIQCLQRLSPVFLADVYLPNKIEHGGWI